MDSLWQTPSQWPRASAEYVFLARAVDAVGRTMFGDDWRLSDFAGKPEMPLPSYEVAHPPPDQGQAGKHREARDRAQRLLSARSPTSLGQSQSVQIGLPSLNRCTPAARPLDYTFTREQWAEARALVDESIAAAAPGVARLARVRETVLDAAVMGHIYAFRRAKNNAAWTEMSGFCKELERWLLSTHPEAAPASAKTIGNNPTVSALFRQPSSPKTSPK